jgi:hypothetical protein
VLVNIDDTEPLLFSLAGSSRLLHLSAIFHQEEQLVSWEYVNRRQFIRLIIRLALIAKDKEGTKKDAKGAGDEKDRAGRANRWTGSLKLYRD